ncbi:XK-related protein 6 [Mactra antiquata]
MLPGDDKEASCKRMALRRYSDPCMGKISLQIPTVNGSMAEPCDIDDRTALESKCYVPNEENLTVNTLTQKFNDGSIEFIFTPSTPKTPSTPGDPINLNELVLNNLLADTFEPNQCQVKSHDVIATECIMTEGVEVAEEFSQFKPQNLAVQDLVMIEMTKKSEPIRSPLFSRIHLSSADLNSQIHVKLRTLNSWKSGSLPSTGESRKCYFKYLNRQISVSSPALYQADKPDNADENIKTIENGNNSSAMFYVNDSDDEAENANNFEISGLMRSKQSSLKSFRSTVSRWSGCTINSGKRISIHSHVDIDTTDIAEVVSELSKLNQDDLTDSASFGFVIDNFVDANTKEQHQDKSERQKMPKLILGVLGSLLFPLFSVLIYIWDFGSDIRMAMEYWYMDELEWFIVTLLCIVLPLLLMTITDLSWLWMDRPQRPHAIFLVKLIFGILSLGRISRAVCHMAHIIKSKVLRSEGRRRWHHDRAMDEKRDCYMLDFINTFTESVPQLFVQLYLYFTYHLPLSRLRFINIFTSWISVAWVYAAYYRCNRRTMTGRNDVNIVGFSFFFLSILSCLAARVISIIHFLLTYDKWICAIVLFIHSFLAFFWIVFRLKPEMEGVVKSKLGRFLYYLFFAYVYNSVFIHVSNSPGKNNLILFYVILYIENFILGGLALYKHAESDFKDAVSLLALPVGLCLHVFFLAVFYKFFLTKALFR